MTREKDRPLQIGALLFEGIDQLDLTGPFEVLARPPDTVFRLYAKSAAPVRDVRGLRLLPDAVLGETPRLDVLVVPGGFGQEAIMEDEETLGWIRRQAEDATHVLSVCTGALILGAAGLLKGRRATTHWAVHHLLPYFGAVPADERVVVDGKVTTTAGVTAGLDGALRLAAALHGEEAARTIQLFMEYAPEPPFDSGSPKIASACVTESVRLLTQEITARREATARRVATRLGIEA
ncbi:DJ-1/PfpI family protein [Methylocystis bryophila]|uniref:AraC family transcriptional regulator n=1 Tax=Methylocystis bryophila TaxID=655015 RepID=A0A1W6MYC6_9HYPH|nr:DJ-1/PfpI family protein [Methylocystis bryophila]ARN82536.1 AraC family transcriptional regulator [Methylocystis bryophila]BDV38739.1 glutamine amidotransferase [Methylocystis bryophila]